MSLKCLPFKRVVGAFFLCTIMLGSLLFIRAYTRIDSRSETNGESSTSDVGEKPSETGGIHLGEVAEKTLSTATNVDREETTTATKDKVTTTEAAKNSINVPSTKESTLGIDSKLGAFIVEQKESLGQWTTPTTLVPAAKPHTKTSAEEKIVPTTESVPITANPTTPPPPPPSLDPKYRDYGEQGCKGNSLRGLFIEILSEWMKLAAQADITYFLYCGSLLGQARDEDVIPYDRDMDVVIEFNDFKKLQKLAQPRGFSPSDGKFHLVVQPEYLQKSNMDDRTRFSCEGKVVPHLMDSCSFVEPMGRLIKNYRHVDIFAFVDKGESIEIPMDYKLAKHKREEVFPILKCKFMGLENVHCPRNKVALLRGYFGDDLAPRKICKGNRWVTNR